jgi:hypothetical protein
VKVQFQFFLDFGSRHRHDNNKKKKKHFINFVSEGASKKDYKNLRKGKNYSGDKK